MSAVFGDMAIGDGSVVSDSMLIVAPGPCFVIQYLLSCQQRVTVTSCFVYNFIRTLESIDHVCINPILWIGLIHK